MTPLKHQNGPWKRASAEGAELECCGLRTKPKMEGFQEPKSNNMGLWVVLKVNERLCGARCTHAESFIQEQLSVCFWWGKKHSACSYELLRTERSIPMGEHSNSHCMQERTGDESRWDKRRGIETRGDESKQDEVRVIEKRADERKRGKRRGSKMREN